MIIRHFGNGKELKVVEVAPATPATPAPSESIRVVNEYKLVEICTEPLKPIFLYTITSSNYHHITKKSIESFLKNCSKQIFHILHSDEIPDKVQNERVVYINVKDIVYNEGYSIENLGIRKYSLFSKALADKVIDLTKYERIVYADSDILYFKDIFEHITTLDKEKVYFCTNGVRDVPRTYVNINSGFIVFSPKNLFFQEWRNEMDRMIKANEDIKYLDQDALIHVFEKKASICDFIPLSILSFKGRREGCMACHYIARKLFRFEADYKGLILGEVAKVAEVAPERIESNLNNLSINDFKFYVINIAKDVDRINAFDRQCKALGKEYTRIDGVIPSSNGSYKRLGAFGCALSHYEAIKRSVVDGEQHCIIFEDDATFCEDFINVFNKFIGIVDLKADIIYLKPKPGKYQNPAEAIIISFEKRKWIVENKDKFLNGRPVDHWYDENLVKVNSSLNLVYQNTEFPTNITKKGCHFMDNIQPQIITMRKNKRSKRGLNFSIDHISLTKSSITMVEVGSYQGESTEIFCSHPSVKKVYSIDPYLSGYDISDAASFSPMDIVESEFIKRMDRFISLNKCIKLKMRSEDAVNYINEPVDFVYIDGCHKYECVKFDLNNWYKKINGGGYIGGHDYGFRGVQEAIQEFIKENGLIVEKTYQDGSWLIKTSI